VRANGVATLSGAYQLLMALTAPAGEQDHQRIAAESLLIEAARMTRRMDFQPSIEKQRHALVLCASC